ncbi:hypothetical protein GJAV_G00139280 [Gymnothorax javanicus]|nr:hypothetical protein GJAV_G00139280 [Gymnothorax javanicus]
MDRGREQGTTNKRERREWTAWRQVAWVTMGVKTKAAVAVVILLVFLGSVWLQGGLENQWHSCLPGFSQRGCSLLQSHLYSRPPAITSVLNDTDTDWERDTSPLEVCPGQDFQVSRLLSHLLAAPTSPNDVRLPPYLSSWDELIKFMEALGPMVGLISQEIEGKTSIIRQLAREDAEMQMEESQREEAREPVHSNADSRGDAKTVRVKKEATEEATEQQGYSDFGESYASVRSMIRAELSRGAVNFAEQTDSGCRTLLRLHRALLWLQLFLQRLAEKPAAAGAQMRSPSELCRTAYQQTLAHHHSWFVRRAAELAFLAMPERAYFFRLLCARDQEELASVLSRVVRAIGEVYQRTQNALEEHGMLNLP